MYEEIYMGFKIYIYNNNDTIKIVYKETLSLTFSPTEFHLEGWKVDNIQHWGVH
jgi:hypothetical protein